MLDEPHVRIGLGGIAKGYAVDKAAKVLLDAGLTSFYVQAGGDLYTRGVKPDGSPWQAGIRDPRGPEGDYFAMMPVSDHAFSTAGDYERSYVVDGKRYHHIIDPRTGYPATASRSVTIWAPTALLADEIDDAVFILGPEKGLALVESLDGVGAVIVDAQQPRLDEQASRGEGRGRCTRRRDGTLSDGQPRATRARGRRSRGRPRVRDLVHRGAPGRVARHRAVALAHWPRGSGQSQTRACDRSRMRSSTSGAASW